jgi:hypothetical protein
MTVISSKEFVDNQKRYFNMAMDEDIYIQNGENMFQLMYKQINNTNAYDEVLEPDDDFRRALSVEEFRKKAIEVVEKVHHKFYGNERKICPRNA